MTPTIAWIDLEALIEDLFDDFLTIWLTDGI